VASEHKPVLLHEALEYLRVRPGGFYVDGTVGPGGHAEEILRRSAPNGKLIAVDRDTEALAQARQRLAFFGERVEFVHADFRVLLDVIDKRRPNGVLLDLGLNSCQLDDPLRGFSFKADGPLDMRFDRSQRDTAAHAVNDLSERELADVIFRYGEDPRARRIAHAITVARKRHPLQTTSELASVVRRAAGRRRRSRLDPATRTFQALRIFVNRELENLEVVLIDLAQSLAPGGRLAVIAFHSLEDRETKRAFRELVRRGSYWLLTPKPIRPTRSEWQSNPRSRSARLRAVERQEAA
jgi:16S rRNA (cytosine1402-N4)-methyltransferase